MCNKSIVSINFHEEKKNNNKTKRNNEPTTPSIFNSSHASFSQRKGPVEILAGSGFSSERCQTVLLFLFVISRELLGTHTTLAQPIDRRQGKSRKVSQVTGR